MLFPEKNTRSHTVKIEHLDIRANVLIVSRSSGERHTGQGLQALPRRDVPHLDCGVCVPRDQDIVPQFHARGEALVSHECMFAGTSLDVPDTDGGVQTTRDHMNPVKLEGVDAVRVTRQGVQAFLGIRIPNFDLCTEKKQMAMERLGWAAAASVKQNHFHVHL